MGRRPCCTKEGLNRGAWTAIEDKILVTYINTHGEGKWRDVPQRAGLKRCGKSCRLRWLNYLRPDIKRGNISHDEEELIIRLHKLLGNRWSLIAGRLPGRTDNEIKNYWNTTLGKKTGNQSPQEQEKSIEDQTKETHGTPSVNTTNDSTVIRTKAVRCTKSVILHSSHSPLREPEVMQSNTEAEFDHENQNSSLCFDETMLFEEEMTGDSMQMDLRAMASFLDLQEEWLNIT